MIKLSSSGSSTLIVYVVPLRAATDPTWKRCITMYNRTAARNQDQNMYLYRYKRQFLSMYYTTADSGACMYVHYPGKVTAWKTHLKCVGMLLCNL